MPKGYSILLADQIKKADPTLLGVKLARVCLDKDIPVSDVADFFKVSRMTIYTWRKEGKLTECRLSTKRVYFKWSDLEAIKDKRQEQSNRSI